MKKIIRLPDVISRTGKSRSSIYQGMIDGTFPKSIKISARSVGWIEEEIDTFVEMRIRVSRPQAPSSQTEG